MLIVDNDDAARDWVASILEAEGYTAEGAVSGPDALDYLVNHPRPGLILLNVMMPMRHGWVFRTDTHKPGWLAGIPIALFSNSMEEEPVAYDPSAPDYLDRPLRPVALLDLVRQRCGTPRSPQIYAHF